MFFLTRTGELEERTYNGKKIFEVENKKNTAKIIQKRIDFCFVS